MKSLSPSWFVDGWVDFEYKKYTLLAYLKDVKQSFDRTRLYPAFSDLIFHYRNLVEFNQNKGEIKDKFPKKLSSVDLENLELEYVPEINENESLQELQAIIDYSIPKFKTHLEEGKGIYEFIEEKLDIDIVGVIPLYKDEGYILLEPGEHKPYKVYKYELTRFKGTEDNFQGLNTEYICSFYKDEARSVNAVKIELLKEVRELPNPATFVIASDLEFPEQETLLPVAKRKFMQFISTFTDK